MIKRAAFFIDDLDLHRSIKILAAEQGISMKALTERLLRLGMVAPELARLLDEIGFYWDGKQEMACTWCGGLFILISDQILHGDDCPVQAALAAYQAALDGKETNDETSSNTVD